jgi:hypothetical protein
MTSSIITYAETLGEDVVAKIKTSLTNFVATDLGTLAVDAVNVIEAEMEGSSGSDKLDAAKTKILNDAGEGLKDLLADGDAILNYAVESALQAVTAGLVSAAVASI